MINFNLAWVEFECPKCRYIIDVQLVDTKSEKQVFCHNCKILIQLSDSEASVHSGIESINHALKEFENTLKNFGK